MIDSTLSRVKVRLSFTLVLNSLVGDIVRGLDVSRLDLVLAVYRLDLIRFVCGFCSIFVWTVVAIKEYTRIEQLCQWSKEGPFLSSSIHEYPVIGSAHILDLISSCRAFNLSMSVAWAGQLIPIPSCSLGLGIYVESEDVRGWTQRN